MNVNQNVLDAITARATTDRAFREQLMAEPNAAIAEITGQPLPSSVKVNVIEQTPGYDATLLLPSFVGDGDEAELSAEELEAVAGGAAAASWCERVSINITFAG